MVCLVQDTTPRRLLWEQTSRAGVPTFQFLFCSSHLKARACTISGVLEMERGTLVGYRSGFGGAEKERVVLETC